MIRAKLLLSIHLLCCNTHSFYFSRSDLDLEVVIILRGSDQYKFIHVEEYGYVVSYAPRLSSGDHHHLVSNISVSYERLGL